METLMMGWGRTEGGAPGSKGAVCRGGGKRGPLGKSEKGPKPRRNLPPMLTIDLAPPSRGFRPAVPGSVFQQPGGAEERVAHLIEADLEIGRGQLHRVQDPLLGRGGQRLILRNMGGVAQPFGDMEQAGQQRLLAGFARLI